MPERNVKLPKSSRLRKFLGQFAAAVVWLSAAGTPLFAQEARPKAEKKAPASWAIATADSVMKRYPDYRQAHPASYFPCPWTYVHGYHLIGFEKLYRSTGDKKYLDYIEKYISSFIDEKGNITGIDRNGKKINVAFNNLDNMLVGNCVIALYETTKDERYKLAADKIRRAFDTYPRNSDGGFWHNAYFKGQMWIDGIFMGQMFLIRYGKTIGDSDYCFNEATRQITLYAKRARKGNGLYLHALSERPVDWADPKTGLSSEVWSEGLGWYALILVETLDALPKDHPQRAEVVDILRRLAVDLKKYQDPKSGRWFQVVDKGDRPDNWTDNSGSAMFVYCLQRGVELGLLNKNDYAPVIARGYAGIVANARINDQGLVDIYSACDGLAVQRNYDAYVKARRSVNAREAVAGFLWATTIVEKPKGPGGK